MATKQQISVIAARLVEFQEGFKNLSTEDAQWLIMNAKKAVCLFVQAISDHRRAEYEKYPNLLTDDVIFFSVGTSSHDFVVKDKFKADVSDSAKVKISFIGADFHKKFFAKTEKPFPGSNLVGRKLKRSSKDCLILEALGGEAKAETSITEIYSMILAQANGASGALFNDGRLNIFYVRDTTDVLRAVYLSWSVGGWDIRLSSVGSSGGWGSGMLIFSRA